jgi:hypothetical protein
MVKRALALWEVLAVICVCAFLLLVVPPMLNRPRSRAFRMSCGTNLASLGKAMMIYANDYEDRLPRAGGRASQWGATPDWTGASRYRAFDLAVDGRDGTASMSACLFLLVKYTEVTPQTLVCPDDKGIREFELSRVRRLPPNFELIDAWDFGPTPQKHVSYAYHRPFGPYTLTTSDEPGFAVAADHNPWMDSPFAKARPFSKFKPDIPPHNGTDKQARAGNCLAHKGEGQNVLFLDTHVEFAKRAYCGLDDDNAYTISADPNGGDPFGTPPAFPTARPANDRDSVLVNDPPTWPTRE